jgi:hypothetical protein
MDKSTPSLPYDLSPILGFATRSVSALFSFS